MKQDVLIIIIKLSFKVNNNQRVIKKRVKIFKPRKLNKDMKIGIKVGSLMTRDFIAVNQDASLEEACKLMLKHKVGSLIIKSNQELKGIITEGDIIRAIARGKAVKKTKVKDVMTKKVITIKPGKDIYDALLVMKKKRVRWLPVTVKNKVIGLLTMKDILKVEPTLFDLVASGLVISEEEEKRKRIEDLRAGETWVKEGPCDECGSYDLLYKVGSRFLCASCKEKLEE